MKRNSRRFTFKYLDVLSKTNQKTFQGDSGGPMICREKEGSMGKISYLTGIVSFGPDNQCGAEKMPGVYTKVSSFAKFINKLKDKITFQRLKVQNQTLEIDEDEHFLVPINL